MATMAKMIEFSSPALLFSGMLENSTLKGSMMNSTSTWMNSTASLMNSTMTKAEGVFSRGFAQQVMDEAPEILLHDSSLAVILPTVVYWVMSIFYHYVDKWNLFEQYKIFPSEEETKRNLSSKRDVLVSVLRQQFFQVFFGLIVSYYEIRSLDAGVPPRSAQLLASLQSFLAPHLPAALGASPTALFWANKAIAAVFYASRYLLAIFIFDTWQFWLHRLAHINQWLYRHVHSHHHRLYTPYAYGALYNHPAETLVLDTFGSMLSSWLVGLSYRESTAFFVTSTVKTVDDHCGYQLPWDPVILFGRWTGNDIVFHNVHHQVWGLKTNFALYFSFWDRLLNTLYQGPPRIGAEVQQAKRELEKKSKSL